MNIQEIKKLLEMFDNSNSVKLKITDENFEISLEKSGAKVIKMPTPQLLDSPQSESAPMVESAPQPAPQAQIESANAKVITSPMVGTFYRAPSPDSPPYVNVGDTVKKGQTIAIVEAMKIMNEIEAEFDCKILKIIAQDAQSVEFSSELFLVEAL